MLDPSQIKEEPEDVKPDPSALLGDPSTTTVENDDDCWAQPLFTYKELGILAVMNTDSKQLSQDGIGYFIEKHFPFYKYEPDFTGCKLRTSGGFQRYQDKNGEWVYQLDTSQLDHALKKFHKFYRCYPDPSSKVYSMRYPHLWDDMMKGQYREGKEEIYTSLPSTSLNPPETESVPIVYLKPPIPERFLLAFALLNAPDDCMQAPEMFAFVEYHFPYFGKQTNWKYVGFRTLNATKGIFDKKIAKKEKGEKGKRPEAYFLIEGRLSAMAEFIAEFIVKYPDPKHYGMRHPELWDDMLNGRMKDTPYHSHLVEKMEEELAERAAENGEEMTETKKRNKRKYTRRVKKAEGIPAEELFGLSEPSEKKSTIENSPEPFDLGISGPPVTVKVEVGGGELEPPIFPDIAVKTELEDPTLPKEEPL